ncbi:MULTISPECIES: EF-hand domain-containing protein [unclassified Marinovum]
MSKTRNTLITSALMAVIALSVPATSALAKGSMGGKMGGVAGLEFAHFDQDGDGSLTKEELMDVAKARFSKADTNGDGELTADELKASADAKREARFDRMVERLDTDGNGAISAEEMDAAKGKMRGKMGRDHARGDSDKQGRDHDKRGDGERGDDKRSEGKRGDGERGMKRGGEQREARRGQMFDQIFALADTDGNGTLSQEEFDSAKSRLEARRGGAAPAPAEQ